MKKNVYRNAYANKEFLKELAFVGGQHKILTLEEDNPRYSVNVSDNKIDSDGYMILDSVGDPKLVDGPQVIYKVNSEGFRSQHFKKIDPNSINILYGGCSWTFGEGLPEEFSWTNLLTDKIQNINPNKKVEYYNTGFMGSPIQLIIKNTFTFIREYGKPDYIFLVLPDNIRGILYSLERNKFIKMQVSGSNLEKWMSKDQIRYMNWYEEEFNILNAIDMLKMLEMYCEESGIKILWTTWAENEKETYEVCNFKNFISPKQGLFFKNIYDDYSTLEKTNPDVFTMPVNTYDLPYWEVARDGSHPGTCWTTHISDRFFAELNERNML